MSSEINISDVKVVSQLQKGNKTESGNVKLRLVSVQTLDVDGSEQSGKPGNKLPNISTSNGKSPPGLTTSQSQSGEEQKSVAIGKVTDREMIADAVQNIEHAVQNIQREIKFEVHEETGQTVITVLEKDTQKVLKQFPPEELLILAERLEKYMPDVGLLVDKEV